jgi:hypothetical protein
VRAPVAAGLLQRPAWRVEVGLQAGERGGRQHLLQDGGRLLGADLVLGQQGGDKLDDLVLLRGRGRVGGLCGLWVVCVLQYIVCSSILNSGAKSPSGRLGGQ